MRNILCNIGDEIVFNFAGKTKIVTFNELAEPETLSKIYRIQFSKEPKSNQFDSIIQLLNENREIDLRFYGNYSEYSIDWKSLISIENLQIDLWETKELKDLIYLTNLKKLGISKNVKSNVSLKIIENLQNLENLFVSISKDIDSIKYLEKLKFLSLREIKTKNVNFLSDLKNLNEVWFSLGSYQNIDGIKNLEKLEKLSIHQIRNFSNNELNSILAKCFNLKSLELQNLKNLESLDFMQKLTKLQYIFLDGNKNIKTFREVAKSKNLKTFSTSNSRAEDKNLTFLQDVENIFLGDSYPKNEIENFSKIFTGKNLWIYGKEIKGKLENNNPFRI